MNQNQNQSADFAVRVELSIKYEPVKKYSGKTIRSAFCSAARETNASSLEKLSEIVPVGGGSDENWTIAIRTGRGMLVNSKWILVMTSVDAWRQKYNAKTRKIFSKDCCPLSFHLYFPLLYSSINYVQGSSSIANGVTCQNVLRTVDYHSRFQKRYGNISYVWRWIFQRAWAWKVTILRFIQKSTQPHSVTTKPPCPFPSIEPLNLSEQGQHSSKLTKQNSSKRNSAQSPI